MPATAHTIEITTEGVDNPTLVYPHDTVKWLAVGTSVVGGVKSATITFTGSVPFTESLSGTLTLSGGKESSTYTVSTTKQPGKYPYTVVANQGNGVKYTFSCDIQVLSGDTVVISSGG
jgi:hypothetical protein